MSLDIHPQLRIARVTAPAGGGWGAVDDISSALLME